MQKALIKLVSLSLIAASSVGFADSCPSIQEANQIIAKAEAMQVRPQGAVQTVSFNYGEWTAYASYSTMLAKYFDNISQFNNAQWNVSPAYYPNMLACSYTSDSGSTQVFFIKTLNTNPIPTPNPDAYWVTTPYAPSGAVCGGPNFGSKATDPSQCVWSDNNAN